jgi:hypothetical protein
MRGGVQPRVHVPPRHPPADSAETLRGHGAKPPISAVLDDSVNSGNLKLSMQNNAKTSFFNNL